jgi:hypothetical protein
LDFYLVVLLVALLVAALAAGALLLKEWRGPATGTGVSTQSPAGTPAIEFVKKPQVAAQWISALEPLAVVEYFAEMANTSQQRLRFYVEWFAITEPLTALLMSPPQRAAIGEYKDYVKGENIRLTLISRTVTPDRQFRYWWGGGADQQNLAVDAKLIYGARVTALADNGATQHFYFFVIPGFVNDTLRPNVLKMETFVFPKKWEERDAR